MAKASPFTKKDAGKGTTCKKCGAKVPAGASKCPKCGYKV